MKYRLVSVGRCVVEFPKDFPDILRVPKCTPTPKGVAGPSASNRLKAIVETMRKQAAVSTKLADAMKEKGINRVDAMNLPMMVRYETHDYYIMRLSRTARVTRTRKP